MPKPLKVNLPSDTQIEVIREFDAPAELVFRAWFEPALVRRWLLGPPGWSMPVCEVDLSVGGKFRYEWRSDAGKTMALSGVYREIEAPRRIADTQRFDDDWTHGEGDTTLTLEEVNGRTELTLDLRYASKEVRDMVAATPMLEGMESGYARMEGVLA